MPARPKTPESKPTKKAAAEGASLVEFIRKERLKHCPVCQLPKDILTQLQEAPEKKIRVEDRVRWLNEVYGMTLTIHDLSRHMAGRHYYV